MQQSAERPAIDCKVVCPAQQMFRGLILYCGTLTGRVGGDHHGVAEIGQHYMARVVDENIERREVPVNDIRSMQR